MDLGQSAGGLARSPGLAAVQAVAANSIPKTPIKTCRDMRDPLIPPACGRERPWAGNCCTGRVNPASTVLTCRIASSTTCEPRTLPRSQAPPPNPATPREPSQTQAPGQQRGCAPNPSPSPAPCPCPCPCPCPLPQPKNRPATPPSSQSLTNTHPTSSTQESQVGPAEHLPLEHRPVVTFEGAAAHTRTYSARYVELAKGSQATDQLPHTAAHFGFLQSRARRIHPFQGVQRPPQHHHRPVRATAARTMKASRHDDPSRCTGHPRRAPCRVARGRHRGSREVTVVRRRIGRSRALRSPCLWTGRQRQRGQRYDRCAHVTTCCRSRP